ncbi:RHS repeat-associated protein [Streptosporangium sandarakinum]|uniref:RHS repeat-associated protein n=2 Tax=Streptosporangium sandarakinum TaxID=1260955 RepID=A0A852V0T3_9ACTN|nr:RHS repeat-associated protein [Streptosporangium sandarakinum]
MLAGVILTILIPALLDLPALPAMSATVEAGITVPMLSPRSGEIPVQLSGTASGVPSLVPSAQTATGVRTKELSSASDAPKKAVPAEGRFVKESTPQKGAPHPSKAKNPQGKALSQALASSTPPCGNVSPWKSNYSVTKGERVASASRIWEALQGIEGWINTTPPENASRTVWADRGPCPLPPAPTVTSLTPADESLLMTLQPTLAATAKTWSGGSVGFDFTICDSPSMMGDCVYSEDYDDMICCGLSGEWKVPEGVLSWGREYWWQVYAVDASTIGGQGASSSIQSFTVGVRQPTITSQLSARGINGQEFHQAPGNYTTTFTDIAVQTAGPPLSVVRSYNSMDPRRDGAFGAGWATRFDMRIVPETIRGYEALLVTYPDGHTVRFATKKDGTFQPPPGMYATLAKVETGGWRLMDKSSTSYVFDAQGRLLKVTDSRGRSQTLTYGPDGKLSKVTGSGGRFLSFTWTGAHVTGVSTDSVDGEPLTWSYSYTADRLTKVCTPTTTCTQFDYETGSLYRSSIQDADPFGYWRLGDASGNNGADLGWGAGSAYYSGVTLGKPGALAGSTDTAAELKSSSYVELPVDTLSRLRGQGTLELWFKTTVTGRIVSSGEYSASDPVLQVGTDGKLRASMLPTASPIVSSAAVNDGAWHHAALTIDGDKQTLFLDGQSVGTLTQKSDDDDRVITRIGGSLVGTVDEVAVYDRPLTEAEVTAHFGARTESPNKLTKITLPSGRVWAVNTYDTATERLISHTDSDGGTWKIGAPAYDRATGKSTVVVTDPKNEKLTFVYDAWRGYRPVSTTDQLGKVTSYAYDTGGFLKKITDPNGNAFERFYDKRGNVISSRRCRTSASCQLDYQQYYLNKDDQFDPRNDRLVASRDARSSGSTDNTYASKWEYNEYGEPLKETTPVTADFPNGRSTTTAYTDGTEPAIGGGDTPAGLVKSAKDAKGNETTYRYTSAGDLAEQTSPSGLVTKFTYDAVGRMLTRTEVSEAHPTGATTTFTYDGLGRMLTQTGPGVKNEVTNVTHTAKVTYTYDADGNKLTETLSDLTGGDPERVTTYTYDASGRVETVTDPEGGVVRTAWDATGARVSTTDQLGVVRTFGYTKRGEPTTTTLKNWTGSPVSPQPAKDVVLQSLSYDPGGRLAAQVDAMGRKTSYTYFADNLVSQVVADDVKLNGLSTTTDVVLEDNVYDPAGNLTKQVKGGGKATTEYVYDAASRLTSTTFDPATLKRKVALEYDEGNNVTKKTLTGAGTTRTESTLYAYNALNQVTRQTVENGDDDLVSTSTYDDRGLLVTTTDPRGNASGATAADFTATMRYDIAGRLVETISPRVKIEKNGSSADGHPKVAFGYDTAGLVTHTVDAEGRKLTSAFDKAGRLISTVSPSYIPPGGEAVTPKVGIEYDAAGRKTKVTDERGYVTSTEYDALGNPVRVTDPGPSGPGGQWVTQFDLLGEPLATIDPTGARDEATYDDLGRNITETRIERRPTTAAYTTTLSYDTADNLIKSVAPGDKVTDYEVNAAGEITATTDPNLNKSTVAYDLAGRTVKVTDPLGNAAEAVYDLAGRQTGAKDLDATGAIVRTLNFGYDPVGNQTRTISGEGHVTRRTFDAAGRLTVLSEPVSAEKSITTTFGYDATGARTRLTDGRGNATWTTYNVLGLAESVIEPATTAHPNAADRTWTTLYDAAGNAVTTLQPGGVRIDRVFDHLGQVTKQTGAGAGVDTPERNLTYDAAGRLTAIGDYTLEYNDRSLLTKVSKATVQVAAYAYDGLGNTTQRVDTAGTSTYTYDNASRLKTATDPVTGRTWTYGYDNADRLTSQTSANPAGTQSYTYDAVDRLTSHTLKNSGGTQLSKIAYDWDKDDNLVTKITSGTAGAGVNTYGYDHSGRLTSWTAPDGKATAYEWDDAGNRTKAGDKTFVYDERNRLLSGGGTEYTYTARGTVATETTGGVTKNLVFDAFDRMISDGEANYGYDALGRMTSRTEGTDQQRFVYSGLSNDLVTVANASNVTVAKYGRDLSGGLLSLQEGAGPALGVMADLHGDVVGAFSGTTLVDSVAYDPFGEVTHRSGTVHTLGYQGEYTDPDTGKVNMDARWYRPGSGTFTSRDTVTLEPNPSVQANRYTYANASPLTGTDPSGHSTTCSVSCVVNTAPSGGSGAGAASGWTFSWSDYIDEMIARQQRAADWSAPTTIGEPYISPTCCSFNGSSDADSMWWEERFGDYANPALWCSESEARKSKLLPNCRPMPEGMEGTFWNAPKSVQNKFLLQYNIKQMYSTDVSDAYILASWIKLLPPPPMAAGPAPGTIDPWEACALKYSKKACQEWRAAAAQIALTNEFKSNCSKATLKKLEYCINVAQAIGLDANKVINASTGIAQLDALADLIKPLMGPTNEVINFLVGDAISCTKGDILACVVFAANFAAPPVGMAAKIARAGKAVAGIGKALKGTENALGAASKACRRSSFLPGTKVLMADGSYKKIEELKVGDKVIATDPRSGITRARRVSVIISSKGDKDLVRVAVDIDGAKGNKVGAVVATDTHPFWVANLKEWRTAGELQLGQWLRTSAGTYVQVARLTRWKVAEQRVHNLSVDGLHTYHVLAGTVPLLVHNSTPCLPIGPQRPPGTGGDWVARKADNGQGIVWQAPNSTGNANMIRVMNPSNHYQYGYVRFYNKHGQPVGLDGKPGPNSHTHIPLNPDGTYQLPVGW